MDNKQVLERYIALRLKRAEREAEKLRHILSKIDEEGNIVVMCLEMIPGFLDRMRRDIGVE